MERYCLPTGSCGQAHRRRRIHAVRRVKKVEIVVELQLWSPDVEYDRTGLDTQYVDVMGVNVPRVVIPVSPGKNITVISEVIAMNALMKMSGVNLAEDFNNKIIDAMKNKGRSIESELKNAFRFTDEMYE